MGLSKAYLVLYNTATCLGWYYLAFQCYNHLAAGASVDAVSTLFVSVKDVLVIMQLAQCIEVVHAALGLVPGGIAATLTQMLGRGLCLGLVMVPYTELHASPVLGVVCLTWTAVELVRYPFYLCGLLGIEIYPITWLRYTVFYPLYPLGAGAEAMCFYLALEHAGKHCSTVFEVAGHSVNAAAAGFMLVIALYPVMFPGQYKYMIKQRRKKLGGDKPARKNKSRKQH